jgi:large subunit ribosomal protein L24
MKKEWSRHWVRSVQPRKQRKYRHKAPLHARHRFMSANLSPELRRRFGKRSMPVRKGDEVEVMRGSQKGLRGTVSRVDLGRCRVYADEIKVKKVDASEVMRPLQPSNLKIVKLKLDDKMREKVLDRVERKARKTEKKAEKKERGEKREEKKKPRKKPRRKLRPKRKGK